MATILPVYCSHDCVFLLASTLSGKTMDHPLIAKFSIKAVKHIHRSCERSLFSCKFAKMFIKTISSILLLTAESAITFATSSAAPACPGYIRTGEVWSNGDNWKYWMDLPLDAYPVSTHRMIHPSTHNWLFVLRTRRIARRHTTQIFARKELHTQSPL